MRTLPVYAEMNNIFLLQLDGVSGPTLDYAFDHDFMPYTKSLLTRGWKKRNFFCGLPSTTPASQVGLLYGVNNLVPGFWFFSKREKKIITPFFPATLSYVEEEAGNRHPSLIAGGVSIFTLFTGGADISISMSGISRSRKNIREALGFFLNPIRVFSFAAKICMFLIIEHNEHKTQRGGHTSPFIRMFHIVKRMAEEITDGELALYFSKKMIRDKRPAIYVDFTGYDEIAHLFGPRSRFSLYYLSLLDLYIKGCMNAIEKSRVPYECVILSDHGQTDSVSYESEAGESFVNTLRSMYPTCAISYKKTDLDQANVVNDDLVIMDTGNMVLVYDQRKNDKLSVEAFEKTYPDFFRRISQLPAVECVVGRTASGGGVVYTQGKTYELDTLPPEALPEVTGETRAQVTAHLQVLLDAPDGADAYILGKITKDHVVSLTDTPGVHGGIGGEQADAFVISRNVDLGDKPIHDISDLYAPIWRYAHAA